MAKAKNETVSDMIGSIPLTQAGQAVAEVMDDAPRVPVIELTPPVTQPTVPAIPTIGRIVIFKLSEQHAAEINRRRTTPYSIGERIKLNCNSQTLWPIGAQAHIGNGVNAGDEYPMIVVHVWSDTCVNGQVLLDGCDTYWATSVSHGEHNGMWHWPSRV